MFSQWRNAVETTLSQHSPKPSLDSSTDEHTGRGSIDTALRQSLPSSTQLADTALSSLGNLRKTLGTQRPASPVTRGSPTDTSTRPRVTLEDRLRAKFALGEASAGTSPAQSATPSPAHTPTSVIDHPLSPSPSNAGTKDQRPATVQPPELFSPRSVPLPDSPAFLPSVASPTPVIPSLSLISPSSGGIVENPATSLELSDSPRDSGDASERPPQEEPEGENIAEASVAGTMKSTPAEQSSLLLRDPEESEPTVVEVAHFTLHNAIEESHDEPSVLTDDIVVSDEATQSSLEETPPSSITQELVNGSEHDDLVLTDDTSLSLAIPVDNKPSEELLSTAKQVDQLDIEVLQERLKLVQQRFSDVSMSFKRLQTEKAAADRALSELTPLQTIQEIDALRNYLQNVNLKAEMTQDEIKRLTGKLTRQEERIEELRDIHRLESKSQSDQIEKLRGQVNEAEALLKVAQVSASRYEEETSKTKADISRLQNELDKTKAAAKDEEEKRVKAISLLKTVRQKLVKAEKERDDSLGEVQTLTSRDKEEREKERTERLRLQNEIDKVNLERETAVQGLRALFDKEVAVLKERHEKEVLALRGQFELDAITLKSLHSKELEVRTSRISDLETSVQTLSGEKDEIFDQLQMRQAELESSQSHLESLQSQTVELQYQLREATDRIALLNDELFNSQQAQSTKLQGSPEEVTRLLLAAEAKYEGRIADLRRQLSIMERERDEGEAELSKKLSQKTKEVDELKAIVNSSSKEHEQEQENVISLQEEMESLKAEIKAHQSVIAELGARTEEMAEGEAAAQSQVLELNSRITGLQQQIEESKAREAQIRAHNKTLREELRKVQSSAALLERQRNPGAGYWASKPDGQPEMRSQASSSSDLTRDMSSRPNSPSAGRSDEEVNYEYLRNVILQFLEHKEMRPHLVRILSTILRFTPQETRRLVAKA